MAKKRKGHELLVYHGTAGSTADTHIDANVGDVDPGIGQSDYVDRPTRGDGSEIPEQDEQPVKINYAPTFSMEYHDGDANITALLAAADANPKVGKAFKFVRYSGGATIFDKDCYIDYSCPGPIAEGQTIEFTLHRTSDYGR